MATSVADAMKDSKSLSTTVKFIAVLAFLAILASADAFRRTDPVPTPPSTPVPTPVPTAQTPESTLALTPPPRQPTDSRSVLVWVNTNTGVYHCPNTRWYGKTKSGKYMTQEEAESRGHRHA
ncbi:MAG TPA: hypothetical protein VFR78_12675 [Pyrinomonadaceae bacterium]|nr:hypothetical protein [Pyrinomonadaceae bacterium]